MAQANLRWAPITLVAAPIGIVPSPPVRNPDGDLRDQRR